MNTFLQADEMWVDQGKDGENAPNKTGSERKRNTETRSRITVAVEKQYYLLGSVRACVRAGIREGGRVHARMCM